MTSKSMARTAMMAVALFLALPAAAEDAAAIATTEVVPAAAAPPISSEAVATARIIFFRPKKFAGGAVVYKVREGDSVLGKLSSGSFFAADVPAGTHTYFVKSEGKDDSLELQVEAGGTYYVAAGISMGFFAGQGTLTASDEAAFEVANKKKLKDRSGEKVD